MNKQDLTLLTDLYELTMMQGYYKKGQELIAKELRRKKITNQEFFKDENIEKILNQLKLNNLDELYINVGDNKIGVNQIINILKEENLSKEEFVNTVTNEVFNDTIYVFTPKGDVMELPLGATPVDFAYRIHSDIGDHMVSAIVNDNIVPLNYELQDGDIIKINTNKASKPNLDWLDFVKTPQAKSKIKSYFKY